MLSTFQISVGHFHVIIGEYLFKSFLNQVIYIFDIERYDCFKNTVYLFLIWYIVCKYFFPICRLPFNFGDCSFCCAETFQFDIEHLLIFTSKAWVFGVKSKKSLQNQCWEGFSLFSYRIFTVSGLTFRFLIHLMLTWCMV